MGIIDYGDSIVIIRNGKEVEVPPNSFAINGQRFYDFDSESGVLRVNRGMIPEGELEKIMGLTEPIPPEGGRLVLALPFHRPVTLQGVKKIEYLPEDQMLVPQQQAHEPSNRSGYTLFQRLINYARGK